VFKSLKKELSADDFQQVEALVLLALAGAAVLTGQMEGLGALL